MSKPVETLEDIKRLFRLNPITVERVEALIEMAYYLGAKDQIAQIRTEMLPKLARQSA